MGMGVQLLVERVLGINRIGIQGEMSGRGLRGL